MRRIVGGAEIRKVAGGVDQAGAGRHHNAKRQQVVALHGAFFAPGQRQYCQEKNRRNAGADRGLGQRDVTGVQHCEQAGRQQ